MRELNVNEMALVSGGEDEPLTLPPVTVTGTRIRNTGGGGFSDFTFSFDQFGGGISPFSNPAGFVGFGGGGGGELPVSDEIPLCEASQIEGTCLLESGTMVQDGMIVFSEEERQEITQAHIDALAQVGFIAGVIGTGGGLFFAAPGGAVAFAGIGSIGLSTPSFIGSLF